MPSLDVPKILTESYRDLARNAPLYLRLIPVPLAASVAATLWTPPAPPTDDIAATLLHMTVSMAIGFGCFLLTLPTATAWHRLVVLGPSHPRARLAYRFGSEELSYMRHACMLMLYALPVAALASAMLLLFLAVTGAGETTTAITRSTTFNLILQAAAIALVAPRFILLPGTAIGQRTRLRDARTLLRMNYGRMRALVLLAWLPQAALAQSIDLVAPAPAAAIAKAIVGLFFLAIGVGVLSHAYVWLTGRVVVAQRLRGV
ncbi:MAG: hypothetical protein JNK67_02960 [Alphaproteobacteria bacterium]|nr:hypothetical protein [Alphaproteobacteria bacterium]